MSLTKVLVVLGDYELAGLRLYNKRKHISNRSDIIRRALRSYFDQEGISVLDIEKEIEDNYEKILKGQSNG